MANVDRVSVDRGSALSLEVIIDGYSSLTTDRRSLGPHAVVATRHSGLEVLARSTADVVVIAPASPELTTSMLHDIETAFATDSDLAVWHSGSSRPGAARSGWPIHRMRSFDSFGHVVAIRGDLARQLRGFAADRYPHHRWDLLLRAADLHPDAVIVGAGGRAESAARRNDTAEARRRAVQVVADHLARRQVRGIPEIGLNGHVDVRYLPVEQPVASVLIIAPGPGGSVPMVTLETCIAHACAAVTAPHEMLVLTDDMAATADLDRLRQLGEGNVDVLPVCRSIGSGWRMTDVAASLALGDVFVVIDPDVVIDGHLDDWLGHLAALALEPGVGAVGAVNSVDPDRHSGETDRLATGIVAMRREAWCAVGWLPEDPTGTVLPAALRAIGLTATTSGAVHFHRIADDLPRASSTARISTTAVVEIG